jgi:hypothetical protein
MSDFLIFHELAITEFNEKGNKIRRLEYIDLIKNIKNQTVIISD